MFENWDILRSALPDLGIDIGVSLVCGFLLGFERERKDKPAGLRTIILITVGATLYMFMSRLIPNAMSGPTATMRTDPVRIAAQVVSGIGFIGAGTIIQARGALHGLTTAAVIWVAAGIGLVVGLGFPLLGFALTILVLLALTLLRFVDSWLGRRGRLRQLSLDVPDDMLTIQRVENVLHKNGIGTDRVRRDDSVSSFVRLSFTYRGSSNAAMQLLEELAVVDGVKGSPTKV